MRKVNRSVRGFTMVELLVVMVLLAIMVLLAVPKIRQLINQSRMESTVSNVKSIFHKARFEAIRKSRNVVVQALADGSGLRAYIDEPELDVDNNRTDTPFAFEPNIALPEGQRDRVIAQVELADWVEFVAPAGQEEVDGFTNLSGGAPGDADLHELVAVYGGPNGSVEDLGAFRLGDTKKNFLEVRVDIEGTGKVITRKFDCIDGIWRVRAFSRDDPLQWQWYWDDDLVC